MKRFALFVVVGVLLLSLGACSWFKKKSGSEGNPNDLSENDLNAKRENRFGSGSIPTAEGEGVFRDIHFDYDSSAITDVARQDVDYDVQILKANAGVKIQLEGHCDERGTAEYNMALGQTRARAVHDLLVSYGIPAANLSTISYGEEVPLNPGHDESAWAQNRRVHFSAYQDLPAR